jgi:hypothetical protein
MAVSPYEIRGILSPFSLPEKLAFVKEKVCDRQREGKAQPFPLPEKCSVVMVFGLNQTTEDWHTS